MMLALLEIIFGDGRFTIHKFCEFTGPLFVELNKLIHFLVITHFEGRSWWTRRTWGSCRTWKRPTLEVYNPVEHPVWIQCGKIYCLDVNFIVQKKTAISQGTHLVAPSWRSEVEKSFYWEADYRVHRGCTWAGWTIRGFVNRMILRNNINANTKEKEIREAVKRDL